MSPRVSVRMIGPLEVELHRRVLGPRDFGGVKPKQVLEILLIERGRTVTKDTLADRLWGERLPQNSAATLESYVSVLRRALGDRVGRRLVATARGGYAIDASLVDVDVDRFRALLRRAAELAGVERRSALEAAVALARRGELLADEPYAAWVLAERRHVAEHQLQGFVELAESCVGLGDYTAGLEAVEQAIAIEPTAERAHRAAMLAYYARADRDAALRAHVRCREALSEELGISPSPETSELHVAILREEPVATLLGGGSDAAAALGHPMPVNYADNGSGVRIAYQVVGGGPVDLVFNPSFVTNLAATWDEPTYAAFLRRLASISRLILFDKRGTGLSDPALDFPTTRERSDDLLGVLDAVGSERAVLFGVCAGGALCMRFAADHPDRTAGLILHNSFARLLACEDYLLGWDLDRYQLLLAGFEQAWVRQPGAERRNPSLADNPRYRDWFARYIRLAASPWMARRLFELNAELDVRDVLPAIEAPTLVICRTEDAWFTPEASRHLAGRIPHTRTEDAWFTPEASRHLAGRIPHTRLVELPGCDHDPWVGDSEAVLAEIENLLTDPKVFRRTAAHAGGHA